MASEVLKRTLTNGVTNSESVVLNGVNGHTYTILSVVVTETAGAAETFDLFIDAGGGGTDTEVLSDQAVGANETFVFNDRLVLEDEDHLCVQLASSGNVDVSNGASTPANTPNLLLSPGRVSIKLSISDRKGFLFFKKFLKAVKVATSLVIG